MKVFLSKFSLSNVRPAQRSVRFSIFQQDQKHYRRFVSKYDAFFRSEWSCGGNKTPFINLFLQDPPPPSLALSYSLSLSLSLSPPTGKYAAAATAAAARPRSVWLDRFYWRLSVVPFLSCCQRGDGRETVQTAEWDLEPTGYNPNSQLASSIKYDLFFFLFFFTFLHNPETLWRWGPLLHHTKLQKTRSSLDKQIRVRITNG